MCFGQVPTPFVQLREELTNPVLDQYLYVYLISFGSGLFYQHIVDLKWVDK